MVTVGTKPCRPHICWFGPMPRAGGFSGSTRTSWNLTRHTSSSSPANPQPASPETEGCSGRFSEIWQSRHTLPMVRANKMQSNLRSNWRRAPCPTSKHAAKWARPNKSATGFAAGAFWRLVPARTSGNLVLASPKCTCCGRQKDHVVATHMLCKVSSDTHVRPALQGQGCRTTTKTHVSSRILKADG